MKVLDCAFLTGAVLVMSACSTVIPFDPETDV